MINFKRPEDIVPSVLIVLSLVLLAGTLAFMLLVPKPGAAHGAKTWGSTRRRIADSIADTKMQRRRASAAIRPRLWHSDPESVTATILNQLTLQTAAHSLKLTAFRPERTARFEGMTELRFSAQVAGPYAGVRAVMHSLDAHGSKIALRSAQLGLSQSAGDEVTATLGLSAFVETPPDTQANL